MLENDGGIRKSSSSSCRLSMLAISHRVWVFRACQGQCFRRTPGTLSLHFGADLILCEQAPPDLIEVVRTRMCLCRAVCLRLFDSLFDCVFVCMPASACVCAYIYIYIYVCICICACVRVSIFVCLRVSVCVHMCMCVCVSLYVCAGTRPESLLLMWLKIMRKSRHRDVGTVSNF